MKVKGEIVLLVCVIAFCFNGVCQGGSLRKRFYKKTCGRAEDIVRDMTWKNVSTNPNLPAKLLRLHFHDCFVRVIQPPYDFSYIYIETKINQ